MKDFTLSWMQAMDNVEYWKQNSEADYCKTVQNIIKSDPFLGNKFYIFQFIKRVDDVRGIKKMFHQPRLTKPEPLPGTSLLRCDPKNPDEVKILWTLPQKENFNMYSMGRMFSDPFVFSCIQKYENNREEMSLPEPDDLSEQQIKELYQSLSHLKRRSS